MALRDGLLLRLWGWPVRCQRCRAGRPDEVAPVLGLLQRKHGEWWLGAARRLRPVPDVGTAAGNWPSAPHNTTFDFGADGRRAKQLVCRVCDRRLSVKPSKLARGLDPQTHPGAAPDIYV